MLLLKGIWGWVLLTMLHWCLAPCSQGGARDAPTPSRPKGDAEGVTVWLRMRFRDGPPEDCLNTAASVACHRTYHPNL